MVEQPEEREWEEGKARWIEEMSNRMDGEVSSDVEKGSTTQLFDVGMELGDVTVEGDAAYSIPWSERGVMDTPSPGGKVRKESLRASVNDERPTMDTRMSPQPQRLEYKPRKDLPSIEENPIFQRFRNGQTQATSQGQNTALALDGTPPDATDEPLPPYPSNAHFVGAWRVISSPMGSLENPSFEDAKSKSSSNNFILRVDGQVMGGPILDTQYRHKVAGGNWTMFQAIRKPMDQSSNETNFIPQTRLRIRVLVPPDKERALVMEGEVTRLVMPMSEDDAGSSFSSDRWMIPNGGMVDGMVRTMHDELLLSSASKTKGEVLMYCTGEAWIEDALDGGGMNRKKLGTFGLQKLKAIKRQNLIYTVDVSRSIDRGGEGEAVDSDEANRI